MPTHLAVVANQAADNPYDTPGVRLVWMVLGVILLVAAIRSWFGGRH
jgi:hypothetical protein